MKNALIFQINPKNFRTSYILEVKLDKSSQFKDNEIKTRYVKLKDF